MSNEIINNFNDKDLCIPLLNKVDFKCANSLNGIKSVSKLDIDLSLTSARGIKRAREPILIHESFKEIPQRFVNCLNNNSYVRPHMHLVPNQWELMCWLTGTIISLIFDDKGTVIRKIIMSEDSIRIIEIPPFSYHTFVSTSDGAAYLEIRNCAYQPTIDRLYSNWSPEENSKLALDYQKKFVHAEVGDQLII